jgi:CheW-like domain
VSTTPTQPLVDLDLDLDVDLDVLLPYDAAPSAAAARSAVAGRAPAPAAAPAPRLAPAAPASNAFAAPQPRPTPSATPAPQPAAFLAPEPPPVGADTPTAPAQLLQYDRGCCIALPPHTTIELLDRPPVVPVPGAAYYIDGLTLWQGRWLPVLDLHALVNAYRKEHAPKTRYLLIVAYQAQPRGPVLHGAIALPVTPGTVQVSDAARCELPDTSDLWPQVALSCFEIKGLAVPIVDTGRLFGQYHG